ncbi:MAG: SDR family oxidoreductase [Phycisphaerae bacterium]|nr:SDR family oxidoreductase [Phycisphaerae bacterium]
MKKKILVTGGAGFIGSHLVERLLKEGHWVIAMDNFHTGTKDNVLAFLNNPRFEVLRHDVTEPFRIEAEQIYNLACPASPIHYQRSPIRTVETCVLGPINCLTLARDIHARVLQASTSEIYGNPIMHPQTESYWGNVNPIGPRSCYDEGKRVAETLFFDFHREAGTDIRIARIFNTYGPRMSHGDGRVISNFILQALRNEPLTIYGDGSHTRSFCYISDLVEGLIRLMNMDGFTGPINLGCPEERTIREIAELIIQLTNSKSDIILQPLPIDDPEKRKPDIELATDVLGWTPKIPLEEGLSRTIEYYKPIADDNSPPTKQPR